MPEAALSGLFAGLAVAAGFCALVALVATIAYATPERGGPKPREARLSFAAALAAIVLCGLFVGLANA